MKWLSIIIFLFMNSVNSQNSLSELLKEFNTESIPYIFADSLSRIHDYVIILDARERNEYNVSHIKDAVFVGYDNFDLIKTTSKLNDKNATIVVYCSLGIRSEDIAEKLANAGFKNVFNLYGGIFEWKNKDYPIFNLREEETEKTHAFSKEWSKWLTNGEKVYD